MIELDPIYFVLVMTRNFGFGNTSESAFFSKEILLLIYVFPCFEKQVKALS